MEKHEELEALVSQLIDMMIKIKTIYTVKVTQLEKEKEELIKRLTHSESERFKGE